MNRPTVGFAGMTHLGLVSATAIASKGFPTICYDSDRTLIAALERAALPVVEPGLPELLASNGSNQRFSHQREALSACDIVYIATDVPTEFIPARTEAARRKFADVLEFFESESA